MFDIKRLALLKHGSVRPNNIVEAALLNKWSGGPSYEKTVGPSAIVSVSDAKRKPAISLVAGLEPIQDLHGYENPWPAGGGKNLYDKDADYYGQGKFWRAGTGELTDSADYYASPKIPISPNTQYARTSGTSANIFYDANGDYLSTSYTGGSFTSPADAYFAAFNIPNSVDHDTVQFEQGDTLSAYSPYSNICPITGHTGLTAYRTGKNLFNKSIAHTSAANLWVGSETSSGTPDGSLIVGAGTYTISVSDTMSGIYVFDANARIGIVYNNTTLSFTVSATEAIRIVLYKAGTPPDWDNITVMLNLGSSALPYEPYVGTTYPVTWQDEAGTVYGGTVDVVTGVLTVTNIGISFDGTEDWKAPADTGYFLYIINASADYGVSNTGVCSHLPLATNISGSNSVTGFRPYGRVASPSGFVVIMRFDETKQQTLTEFKDYLSKQNKAGTPVTVVYELATPETYQLDPQTVQMLKGVNNLWNDAGESTLTYVGTEPGE